MLVAFYEGDGCWLDRIERFVTGQYLHVNIIWHGTVYDFGPFTGALRIKFEDFPRKPRHVLECSPHFVERSWLAITGRTRLQSCATVVSEMLGLADRYVSPTSLYRRLAHGPALVGA